MDSDGQMRIANVPSRQASGDRDFDSSCRETAPAQSAISEALQMGNWKNQYRGAGLGSSGAANH